MTSVRERGKRISTGMDDYLRRNLARSINKTGAGQLFGLGLVAACTGISLLTNAITIQLTRITCIYSIYLQFE